jgi:hypothetical protein
MDRISIPTLIESRKRRWEEHQDIERDTEWVESVCNKITDPDFYYLIDELKMNPEYLVELTFLIVDKEEATVPFFFNEVQRQFLETFNAAKRDFELGRRTSMNFLILKGRQQGFTSLITALQLAFSMLHKNFTGMTIADNADNTHTIFEDKAKYPYNHMPEVMKPTEKYNNRQELHFAKLNARWRISTAGNKEVGRSKTIRFFHGSEAAFWDSIRKVMTGLGQSLTKKSIKILESTANGFNEFKELWDEAESGENNWTPLFYEWWKTPEYILNFTSEFQRNDFIDKVMNSGSGIYKTINWLRTYADLSWEQLYWYYDKWLELKDLLQQEYPNTPEEAFIATGSQIFDSEKLHQRKAELKKHYNDFPPLVGHISYVYDEELQIILTDTIRFVEEPNGNITVYERPIAGYPYVGAGDIAEGGVDFSAGIILNNNTGHEAAVLHGRFDTDQFAKTMFALGWWFNKAMLAIEVNFDRHPTKELQRLKYPNLYFRESMDTITKQKMEKYGWFTGSASRPLLVDALIILVRDNVDYINHLALIDEMLVFVRDDTGKPRAMAGKHDDLVMARGIAECIRTQQTVKVTEEEKPLIGVYHYQELIMMGWTPYKIKAAVKAAKEVLVATLDSKGQLVYTPKLDFEVIGMPDKYLNSKFR